MSIQSNDLLANLMAEEDIRVVHGNYATAMFDILNRVMYLPVWKDVSENIEILLRAHECGHALYTPVSDIHNSEEFYKLQSAINILEDARIERLLKQKFPGLRRIFTSAYKEVWNKKFFGTTDIDHVNRMNLLDRLNIATKLGVDMNVKFHNDAEIRFLVRATCTQNFDDVVALAEDLMDYCNSTKTDTQQISKLLQQQFDNKQMDVAPPSGNSEKDDSNQDDDGQQVSDMKSETTEESSSEQQQDMDSMSSSSSEEDMSSEDDEITSSDKDDAASPITGKSNPVDEEDIITSETDNSFHKNEQTIVDFNEDDHGSVVTHIFDEPQNPEKFIYSFKEFTDPSRSKDIFELSEVAMMVDSLP